jgi:hypothetical protein
MDDFEWLPEDPRWNSTLTAPVANVSSGQNRTETFTNVAVGQRMAHVQCRALDGLNVQHDVQWFTATNATLNTSNATNATGNASGNATGNGSGGVRVTLVSPSSSAPTRFNVSFVHNATGNGTCTVFFDGSLRDARVTPPLTLSSYEYTLTVGTHAVLVACNGAGWWANASRTVQITAPLGNGSQGNASNASGATLTILGGANLSEGAPFTVVGEGFVPDDDVNIYLTGRSSTISASAPTDEDGTFVYTYLGALAGTYALTARSVSNNRVLAAISVTVLAAAASPHDEPEPGDPEPQITVIGSSKGDLEKDESDLAGQQLQSQPQDELPSPEPEQTRLPDELEQGQTDGGGLGWWWALILAFVILGGLVGFLVYTGALDMGSWDGFQDSVRSMMEGDLSRKQVKEVGKVSLSRANEGSSASLAQGTGPSRPQSTPTLSTFISAERRKGFDDLTIRNALIGRGWDKAAVDRTFDELYAQRPR